MTIKYFDDFTLGEIFETQPYTVTAEEITAFAAQYDPQPFHLPGAADLIASGWQTASLNMRLFVTSGWFNPPPGALGLGVKDLRWHRPVRPGDSIRLHITVLELRTSKSNPQNGILTTSFVTLNQRDEEVQTMVSSVLLGRHGRNRED